MAALSCLRALWSLPAMRAQEGRVLDVQASRHELEASAPLLARDDATAGGEAMNGETMTYTGTLVVTTCWCGIAHAMPKTLYDEAHRTGRETFCPMGHSGVYKDSENERLKADNARLRAGLELERAKVQSAERAAAAARGEVTKLKKRASAGVCSLCHRTFGNVARHMATKHAEKKEKDSCE